jgi:hypothetical protein
MHDSIVRCGGNVAAFMHLEAMGASTSPSTRSTRSSVLKALLEKVSLKGLCSRGEDTSGGWSFPGGEGVADNGQSRIRKQRSRSYLLADKSFDFTCRVTNLQNT